MIRHLIIIGGQRCGTTLLWQLLDQHPDIRMAAPVKPEPKYFLINNREMLSYEGYKRTVFGDIEGCVSSGLLLLGEKSTSYMDHSEVAENIYKTVPDAKIIGLLRDPIDRAVSNVAFSRAHGFEASTQGEALQRELACGERKKSDGYSSLSADPRAYLYRSNYFSRLAPFVKLFGERQLFVVQAEKLFTEMTETLTRICRFLGVSGVSLDLECRTGVNSVKRTTEDDFNTVSQEVEHTLLQYFKPVALTAREKYGFDLELWRNYLEF